MKRRDFLKQAGCGAMGATTLMSSLSSLGALNGLMASQTAAISDYKAMVCILLAGGMDSYNMLVPTGTTVGDPGFTEHKALRTDLGFANASTLLPLTNPQCSPFRGHACHYQSFGVHPGMSGVAQLFNQATSDLAFIANIGTLVEPLANYSEYNAGIKKLPLGIYSHSDQIMQWQTSVPQSREAIGVGGRMADILNANNSNPEISMNISLAGKNVFQRGNTIAEYSISRNVDPNNVGLQSFPTWWGNSGIMQEMRNATLDSMVTANYANLLEKTYSTTAKKSTEAFAFFKEALKRVPTINTTFPTSNLAQELLAITKVMSVRQFLGVKRQIFFVTIGGWDMHDDLVTGLNNSLPVVSQALKAFYDSTVELGIKDNVTTFTISDFARTMTTNGQGSDHAWGGNNMVMGGAVNGGKVYGAYPKMSVANTNPLNVNFRGNFIPAVSTDEMYAELALWYGISPSDLCYILPNLGNFYSYSANNYPIGLMNINDLQTSNHPLGC